MSPISTGAAKAVGRVLPGLKGKLDGTSIRVPTPDVSVVDFKFVPKRKTSVEEVNAAIVEASKSDRLKGILGVNAQPLVSSDFIHEPRSPLVHLSQTQVIAATSLRVRSC